MVIPDSFVVLLLGGSFVACGMIHYRIVKAPDAKAVSLPFWIAFAALLLVFAFLVTGGLWPDWDGRKPLFLGIGLVLFLGSLGWLLHGRAGTAG